MASLIGMFDNPMGYWETLMLSGERTEQVAPWRDQYRLLRLYARNNGLYDGLRAMFQAKGYDAPQIAALRNPCNRVEAFYAAKLWPGPLPRALPIETDNESILPAIEQIWEWGNWSNTKQSTARLFATCGDMFLKASTNRDDVTGEATRVYIQRLDPEVVTYFEADERGFLQYVRLDTPTTERDEQDKLQQYTITEVWDKSTQLMRQWKHKEGYDTDLERLGEPILVREFGAFGIDFIPIVWQPFRDIGEERGEGAFTPAIDKIDEANRQAYRLNNILFRNNRTTWAIQSNNADREGRPVPPPRIVSGQAVNVAEDEDPMIEIPNGVLVPLVPAIDYMAALAVLDSQLIEVRSDLPELAYYTLRDRTDLSGRALRILLADALDRLLEARGNAEAALARANQMCLTIGSYLNLLEVQGTYEEGAFQHTFAEREVFTPDEYETAQTFQTYTSGGMPLLSAARLSGLSEEQIGEIEQDKADEEEKAADMADRAMEAAQRRFDQEQGGSTQPDEAVPNA